MIKQMHSTLVVVFLVSVVCLQASAQSTVYASVVSTKLFIVGAANANTGLHFQKTEDDTTWKHTGASRIRAFGVDVDATSKGKTLYIASGNGLHKTTDGGSTWRITTGWQITEVMHVAPDQRNSDVVYIATAYGIYKTTDGCATWKEMNDGLGSPAFTPSVIVDHSNPSRLFCVSENGLFVSNDAAGSWTLTGFHGRNVRCVAQHPTDPNTMLLGTEDNGIYLTRNGAKSWTKSEAGLDHRTFYAIAYDPIHPEIIYAGGYVSGVYKSVDGGVSWARKSAGVEYQTVRSIALDPTNPNRVYVGTIFKGIYRTENGGETWKTAGLSGSQVYRIVIQPY
jgi:photosystem II stability/assembly factor-like uncharacterized protein